jgi:superfamily II DNA or RNA helicase
MRITQLRIDDEVNCYFSDLELDHRKELVKKFKYEIPGARYLPTVRLGRWDGKVPYFNLGGSTYINLLPEILEYLTDRGYDIELDDRRTYPREFNLEPVTEESFSHIMWPQGHPLAGQPIGLRDYQVEIINNFLSNPQSVQEVATGAGKTIMTAALSQRCEKYGRTIIIVPNKSLVTQTEADYRNIGLDVGVFYGDRKEFGKTHTICTWQSLNSLLKSTKNDEAPITAGEFIEGVVCVMVDEAHAAKADALKQLLATLFNKVPIRWGLTGTIPKEEYAFQALNCAVGPVIGKLTAKELQLEGHLSNCQVNVVQMMDYKEFQDYQAELKYLLETEARLDHMANMINKIAESGNTLVLIDRVEPGKSLTSKLQNAVFVSGSTKAKKRKEEYDEVAEATDKIIVATYGVAAVGINIPRIFNLVLVEPGKSFVRVIQSIGRGLRKAQDKDHVEIWDITSSCRFAKRHLTKRKAFYKEAGYPMTVEKMEWQ